MPRTTQCTHCGVVLNLPDNAIGKRLKCPKCGTKFQAGDGQDNSATLLLGMPMGGPDSSQDIPRTRANDGLPVASGDLRETFDLPMLTEAAVGGPSSKSGTGDALLLFEEKKTPARRPTGAEARSKARRCPTCGGVVPVGMSICPTCGLDLETGVTVGLVDDLAPPPPPRPSGPPLTVGIIGGICLLGSSLATLISITNWMRIEDGGWHWFIPLGLFGIFAAVQFLRGKSAKLLLIALTLGAFINVAALIVRPVINAQLKAEAIPVTGPDNDPNSAGEEIKPLAERLDTRELTIGIGVLLAYAALAAFLCSPPVHRYMRR